MQASKRKPPASNPFRVAALAASLVFAAVAGGATEAQEFNGAWVVDESGAGFETQVSKIPLLGELLGPNAARQDVVWLIQEQSGSVRVTIPERDLDFTAVEQEGSRLFARQPAAAFDVSVDGERLTGTLVVILDDKSGGKNAVSDDDRTVSYQVSGTLSGPSRSLRDLAASAGSVAASLQQEGAAAVARADGLERELAATRQELALARSRIEDARTEIATRDSAGRELAERSERIASENAELTASNRELLAGLESMRQNLGLTESDGDQMRLSMQQLEGRIAELGAARAALEEELAARDVTIGKLERQLAEEAEAMRRQRQDYESMVMSRGSVQQEVGSLRAELAEARKALESAQDEMASTRDRLVAVEAEAGKAAAGLAASDRERQRLAAEVETLASALESQKSENARLSSEARGTASKLDGATDETRQLSQRIDLLETELGASRSQVSALEKQMGLLERLNESLETQIAGLEAQGRSQASSLAEEKAARAELEKSSSVELEKLRAEYEARMSERESAHRQEIQRLTELLESASKAPAGETAPAASGSQTAL